MSEFLGAFLRYRLYCFAVLLAVGFVALPIAADAANRYWVGADTTWNTTANWSATSGGASGALVPGTADVAIFDTGSQSASMGTAAIDLTGLTITAGYAGTVTATSHASGLTIRSSISLQGTAANGGFAHNSGLVEFCPNPATCDGGNHITYTGSNIEFYNVEYDSGGGYDLDLQTNTMVVLNNFQFNDGDVVNGTLGVGGNLTVGSANGNAIAGTLKFTGTANPQTLDVSADSSDIFAGTLLVDKTSGTVNLVGALDFVAAAATKIQVTSGTLALGSSSYHVTDLDQIVIDGGTLTQGNANITLRGTGTGANSFQITSGTFTGGSGSIDMSLNGVQELAIDGGTFTSTSGTLTVGQDFNKATGATFTHNSGTVTATNTTNHTNILSEGGAGTITLYNFTINLAGGFSVDIEDPTTIVVVGTFTRTQGRIDELSTATQPFQVQGNVDIDANETSAGADGGSDMWVTGGANQTIDLATIDIWDNDIVVDKSGGVARLITGLTLNAGGNNTLTIDEGIFDIDGQALTAGTVTANSGGTFRINGDETPTAPTMNSGSTLSYAGTVGPYTVADMTYTGVTLSLDGAATFSLGAAETVGNLTIASGATFDINGNNITVSTTFSNDGTFVLNGNETTVSLTNDTNSGAAKYKGAVTVTGLKAGNTYYDLEFANASGSWTLNAALDVNRNLTITSGTLDVSASGCSSASCAITLAGNMTNSGTFTARTGTVTLDGSNQTLNAGTAGTLTFYNLVKDVTSAAQLTLDDDDTFTISNNLTWTGQSGQLLTIRSDVDSTTADMSVGGTKTVSYLSVRDLNNTGSAIGCMTGCTNGTGNTGWLFASSTTPSSITYQDNDSNGAVDRVVIDFGAAVTLTGTVANTRFTWVSASGANGFAGSLSGNASVTGGDVIITIASADANETGHVTVPTLAYSDNSDDLTNYVADSSGNVIQTFAATNASDGAAPRIVFVQFEDLASDDGKIDLLSISYTETLTATANAAAGFALSSAANFSSIVEGTVPCNSGAAGVAECLYNFTTSTVKTNVGDLSLAYTGSSGVVTDGTNTAPDQTITSASSPAFTDAAKPEAVDAQISIAGASGTGGAYKVSDVVTVTWNAANSSDISSVTANLSGWGGSATATMTDTTACGGTASNGIWEACYTITGSEAIDTTNVNVSVNATDTASNNRSNSDTTNATVDTVVPIVTAAKISATGATGTSGAFKNGDTAVGRWDNSATGDNNSDTISSVTINASAFDDGSSSLSGSVASGIYTATVGTLDSQDDTNNNVTVTVVDNAGNSTATAGTNNYTVDTIVPTLTNTKITVTGCAGTSGACKNGDTATARWDNAATGDNNSDTIASVTFNASAFDDGSSSLSGTAASGIYTATIGTLDSQDDTGNTVSATIVDNAGNSVGPTASSVSYTVDTVVPTVTAAKISVTGASGTSGAFKNGDTAVGRWDNSATGDNNLDTISSVTINASAFDDGSSSLSGSVASGIYTATVGTLDSQDDASNNITVTVVDNAGNSTATAGTNNYTVDTIVPTVTQASITVAGCTGTSGACRAVDSPVLTWNPTTSGESDTIASATFNGSSLKTGDSALTGVLATNWTVSLSGAMTSQDDTGNTITVTVVDNAGNSTGPTTSSASYTADTILPTLSTAVYQDANLDGRVDRIVLTMSEDVSNGFTADKDEWSFVAASELTLVAPTADASVTNVTTTVTLSVGADANETGHTTAPTLSYTNVAGTLKDDAGNALANFTAQAVTDGAAPFLRSSSPANNDQNVSRMDDVVLTFTEAITTASFTYTCCGTGTDPGSRVVTWSSGDTVANIAHAQFQSSNDITIDITAAPDGASNAFAGALSGAADPFTFKTAAAGGIVAGVNDDRIAGGSTVNPTLAVASPNGGETVTTGEEISIAWTQKGRIDTVNVRYSTDGGNTWSDIARAIRNMGYARWVVPNMVTTTARIMVEGTDLATIFGGDQSDGEFTIKPVDVPVTALVPVPVPVPTVQEKVVTRRLLPTESPLPPHLLPIIPLPVSETPVANGLPVGDDGAVSLAKIAKPLPLGAPVVRIELPKQETIELAVGNVFRGVSNPAVYVMRSDGTRSVFPDTDTYDSYFNNFDHVLTVNDDQLRKIPLGKRMTVRPGTWLVKIQSDPRVYTIEQGRVLRHIPDEGTARFLYGKNWNRQVRDVNVAFFRDYEVGGPLPPNAYLPDGTVFSYEEEPQLFILQNRIRRLFLDAESFIFNNYREQFIRNVSLLFEFDEGQPIRSTDPELMKDLVGG